MLRNRERARERYKLKCARDQLEVIMLLTYFIITTTKAFNYFPFSERETEKRVESEGIEIEKL